MAEPRPSMVYVEQSTAQQDKSQGQQTTEPQKAGWMQQGMENFIRATWTALCFVVFCGFSFFLGWHLKGWHFSAYYEGPTVDVVGAKLTYQNPAPTLPAIHTPDDISQATPEQRQ